MSESESKYVVCCAAAGRFFSALVFVDGLIVLAGWMLNRPVFAGFGFATLSKPNTAIALLATAVACWTAIPARQRQQRWVASPWAVFSSAIAAIVMFIGIATLAEITMRRGVDIDRIVLSALPAAPGGRFDMRMSVAAAFGITLLGSAVLTLNTVRGALLTQSLALAASLIGFFTLSGFLFEEAALTATPLVTGTGLPTACGVLLAGLAIIAANPRDGMMRLLTSADLGGAVFRRALLPVALVPVLINWIEVSGEHLGWYHAAIGWTLDSTTTVAALVMLMWGVALIIQRKDVAQHAVAAQLAESEERYRTLIDGSPDAIVVKSGKRIDYVNAATLRMLGVTEPSELVGRPPLALVEPSRRSAVESQLCALLDGPGANVAGEGQVLRRDGTLVDVAVSASAVKVADSRLVQILMRDIGETKRQEQVLRESEERFRLIAETITQVFWMADVNIQTMLYVSHAYEDVWGRSRDSLYQNPKSFLDVVHTDDLARVLDDLRVQQAGLPFDHEYRIVRPDGQIRWIRDRGFPVHKAGQPLRVYVGVAEDITDRRQNAERLRESVERFELVVRATHGAIWEFDVRLGTAWWSDSYRQLFGLGPEIVASFEQWSADVHPADRERVVGSFRAALKSADEQWSEEYRYRRSDGSFATVHDQAYIVRDAVDHTPLRVVGSLRDVTVQRSTEEQFRQAQKLEAIGRLAGGVAHDFNNLLTVILGYVALMRDELPSPLRADLDEIRKAGLSAKHLTAQLLAFSRRQVLEVEPLNLNDVLQDTEKMLRRLIGEDIHLVASFEPDLGTVRVDRGQVEQVILNLAVNARDAMPRGGRLILETRNEDLTKPVEREGATMPPGRYATISVRDTGVGINSETRARIFEPFFTTKELGKGTGLGLSTVYGIVKQSGGFIWVDTQPGEGTTFKIYLPRVDEAPAVSRPRQSDSTPVGSGERLLILEDNDSVRAMMERILTSHGYEVLAAATAEEAAELARRFEGNIALLIADVVLPGISGPEFAERILAQYPATKVLYASGYLSDTAAQLHAVGTHAHLLQKPWTVEALLRRVRDALNEES